MPRIDRRLPLALVLLLAAFTAPSAGALDHGWTIDPNGFAITPVERACTPPDAGLSSQATGGARFTGSLDCVVAE